MSGQCTISKIKVAAVHRLPYIAIAEAQARKLLWYETWWEDFQSGSINGKAATSTFLHSLCYNEVSEAIYFRSVGDFHCHLHLLLTIICNPSKMQPCLGRKMILILLLIPLLFRAHS